MNITALSIGCSSEMSHLPECEQDAKTIARLYATTNEPGSPLARYLAGQVVAVDSAIAAAKTLPDSEHALVHFSGHGLKLDNGQYALWFGNEAQVMSWDDFVGMIIAPLAARCKHVTVLVDACFAGRAVRGKAAAALTDKRQGVVKTLDGFASPAGELALTETYTTDKKWMKNTALIAACGRKQYAYGQFRSFASGGWETLDTCGHSIFSWAWINQSYLAQWPCAPQYAKTCRTVQHVAEDTRASVTNLQQAWSGMDWIVSKPRTQIQTVTMRVPQGHPDAIHAME